MRASTLAGATRVPPFLADDALAYRQEMLRDTAVSGFGPPDLCCYTYERPGLGLGALVGAAPLEHAAHELLGVDASSAAALVAHLQTVLRYLRESTAGGWFGGEGVTRVLAGTYCCYNALARRDVRVSFAVPGDTVAWSVPFDAADPETADAEQLPDDSPQWAQLGLCARMRLVVGAGADGDSCAVVPEAVFATPADEAAFLRGCCSLALHRGLPEHEHHRRAAWLGALFWHLVVARQQHARAEEFFAGVGQPLFVAGAQAHAGRARDALETLLAIEAPDALALAFQAQLLVSAGQPEPALAPAQLAVRLRPAAALPWLVLARAHAAAGAPTEALLALNNIAPDMPRERAENTFDVEVPASTEAGSWEAYAMPFVPGAAAEDFVVLSCVPDTQRALGEQYRSAPWLVYFELLRLQEWYPAVFGPGGRAPTPLMEAAVGRVRLDGSFLAAGSGSGSGSDSGSDSDDGGHGSTVAPGRRRSSSSDESGGESGGESGEDGDDDYRESAALALEAQRLSGLTFLQRAVVAARFGLFVDAERLALDSLDRGFGVPALDLMVRLYVGLPDNGPAALVLPAALRYLAVIVKLRPPTAPPSALVEHAVLALVARFGLKSVRGTALEPALAPIVEHVTGRAYVFQCTGWDR